MKNTGIVRRLDSLGRIVIPKELRRTLDLPEGTSMEIYIEDDRIVLHKYQSEDMWSYNEMRDALILAAEKTGLPPTEYLKEARKAKTNENPIRQRIPPT